MSLENDYVTMIDLKLPQLTPPPPAVPYIIEGVEDEEDFEDTIIELS